MHGDQAGIADLHPAVTVDDHVRSQKDIGANAHGASVGVDEHAL